MPKTIALRATACAAATGALLALSAPVQATGKIVVDVNLTDTQFEPAEIKVPAGQPFTLKVHNKSNIAAEIESNDLRFEKIVGPNRDVIVNVRASEPGRYLFYNDFKLGAVQGHIVAE